MAKTIPKTLFVLEEKKKERVRVFWKRKRD
jgi:hypothetical protein